MRPEETFRDMEAHGRNSNTPPKKLEVDIKDITPPKRKAEHLLELNAGRGAGH